MKQKIYLKNIMIFILSITIFIILSIMYYYLYPLIHSDVQIQKKVIVFCLADDCNKESIKDTFVTYLDKKEVIDTLQMAVSHDTGEMINIKKENDSSFIVTSHAKIDFHNTNGYLSIIIKGDNQAFIDSIDHHLIPIINDNSNQDGIIFNNIENQYTTQSLEKSLKIGTLFGSFVGFIFMFSKKEKVLGGTPCQSIN